MPEVSDQHETPEFDSSLSGIDMDAKRRRQEEVDEKFKVWIEARKEAVEQGYPVSDIGFGSEEIMAGDDPTGTVGYQDSQPPLIVGKGMQPSATVLVAPAYEHEFHEPEVDPAANSGLVLAKGSAAPESREELQTAILLVNPAKLALVSSEPGQAEIEIAPIYKFMAMLSNPISVAPPAFHAPSARHVVDEVEPQQRSAEETSETAGYPPLHEASKLHVMGRRPTSSRVDQPKAA